MMDADFVMPGIAEESEPELRLTQMASCAG